VLSLAVAPVPVRAAVPAVVFLTLVFTPAAVVFFTPVPVAVVSLFRHPDSAITDTRHMPSMMAITCLLTFVITLSSLL
jgi:hypothetical protein